VRRIFHRSCAHALKAGERVLLRALLLAAVLCATGCGSDEPALAVRRVGYWQMPPEGAFIPAPRSVAIGPDDEAFVLDTAGRVLVFDETGKLLRKWFMPDYEVGQPEGVCVLRDGRIAVADTHYSRVVLFDAQGKLLGTLGELGSGPGQFMYPVGIVQDDLGCLYVCEYGGNDRVQKFTEDGTFILSLGSFGTGESQFQRPSGMVWREGRLYVADAINNRVLVYADDGYYLGVLGGGKLTLHYPYDIALGRDLNLYAVEYGAGRLTCVSLAGELIGRYGTTGRGDGELSRPWGLAVDSKNRLRITDTDNRRIVELQL
jgi:DNA-binding beta-propeller fold protein YncE